MCTWVEAEGWPEARLALLTPALREPALARSPGTPEMGITHFQGCCP